MSLVNVPWRVTSASSCHDLMHARCSRLQRSALRQVLLALQADVYRVHSESVACWRLHNDIHAAGQSTTHRPGAAAAEILAGVVFVHVMSGSLGFGMFIKQAYEAKPWHARLVYA